jgi:platelet-activating factor acetylhydrolase IB subunit alpha
MIAYLSSIKSHRSVATLREELQLAEGFDDVACKRYEGLLEKKWTSVVRLQRKVYNATSPESTCGTKGTDERYRLWT